MNEPTPINSELLSADAYGRKHIPVAVFAVILIHVVLFVVLLVAAGCRASARAKATMPPVEAVAQPTATSGRPEMNSNLASVPAASEAVMATEPEVEPEIQAPSTALDAAIYVVQSGDTVGEIARRNGTTIQAINAANNLKNHLIHPGQKLRLRPESAPSAPSFHVESQVKSSQPKRSNEV